MSIETLAAYLSQPGTREFACGGDLAPEACAEEWIGEGFSADEAEAWIGTARCFEPRSARHLLEWGVTPEQAATPAEDGETVGYRVANGDLSAAKAAQLFAR